MIAQRKENNRNIWGKKKRKEKWKNYFFIVRTIQGILSLGKIRIKICRLDWSSQLEDGPNSKRSKKWLKREQRRKKTKQPNLLRKLFPFPPKIPYLTIGDVFLKWGSRRRACLGSILGMFTSLRLAWLLQRYLH